MLHASTIDYTPPEAANFLHQQGLTPATPRQAYAMLAAQAEGATQHKTEGIVLSKLRSALNTQPEEPQSEQQRQIEIARLTRERQSKRKLTALCNRAGHTFTEPTQIAEELKQFWSGVMATQQSVDCGSPTPTRGATQQGVDCESLTPTRGATQQSVD